MEYKYIISNCADEVLFEKQCRAIEKRFSDIGVIDNLEDVDGSKTREYKCKHGNIDVINDCYLDVLRVTSTFDLLPYFKN